MVNNRIIASVKENEMVASIIKKMDIIEMQINIVGKSSMMLSEKEEKYIAKIAHVLAASNYIEDKKTALYIATTLLQLTNKKDVVVSLLEVLTKLSNFPTISYIEKQDGVIPIRNRVGGLASLEIYVKESLNTEKFYEKEYKLTNFQKKIMKYAKGENAISISAPTSAGKSFILTRLLLESIEGKKGVTSMYIVPTKALIRQVMNDVQMCAKEYNIQDLYVGCSPEVFNMMKTTNTNNILILTQERLYKLCADQKTDNKNNMQMIIIDEAQGIANKDRGVILEESIQYAMELWPKMKLVFASPLIDNPDKLLEVFDLKESKSERDQFPLVKQNIVRVNIKRNKLQVVSDRYNEQIAEVTFKQNGTSRRWILSQAVIKLWNNQISIVYANEAILATDVARELVNSGEFPILNNPRLNEFAEFIEQYICNEYELADFVRRGIAFHFGALPALIKSGIEDLFKDGELRIVCCTSTLLEGVNMPARNLFIYHPQQGRGNAISMLSFWNLAGRAGRMGKDLSGNIFCIEPEKWVNNPLDKESKMPILPAIEERLTKECGRLEEYIKNKDIASNIDKYNEQLESKIVIDRIMGRRLIDTRYVNEGNIEQVRSIDSIIEDRVKGLTFPSELIRKMPGIRVNRLQQLWDYFNINRGRITELLPVHPEDGQSFICLCNIIGVINEVFVSSSPEKLKWTDKQCKRIAAMAISWIKGETLSKIIFYNYSFANKKPKQVTKHIKEQIDDLENLIGFMIVKYMYVYEETLKRFLVSIGMSEKAEKVISLSAYIEYGTCSILQLTLMNLGIPRAIVIELSKIITVPKEVTKEYCVDEVKRIDVKKLDMPEYLRRQILVIQEKL